jgi:hypothetical protein
MIGFWGPGLAITHLPDQNPDLVVRLNHSSKLGIGCSFPHWNKLQFKSFKLFKPFKRCAPLKSSGIFTLAVRLFDKPLLGFLLRCFYSREAQAYKTKMTDEVKAKNYFWTPEVTAADAGSKFKVLRVNTRCLFQTFQWFQSFQPSKTFNALLRFPLHLDTGRERLVCAFLPPYFALFSRTAPAPADLTTDKPTRSKGFRVVRLLASKTSMETILFSFA